MKLKLGFLLVLLPVLFGFIGAYKADDITGKWLNADKDAHIEIYKSDNKYFGKIAWMKNPKDEKGNDKTDNNNPDPKLRSRKRMGLVIIKNLKFDGSKSWEGGEIYDPKSGKTYSLECTLESKDKLNLRGYVGLSMFGKTTQFTRVKD